jgi:hypothetical protein
LLLKRKVTQFVDNTRLITLFEVDVDAAEVLKKLYTEQLEARPAMDGPCSRTEMLL